MKRYIKEYIKQLETSIHEQKEFSKEEREEIKCKILFFQHERFIHLVVTIAFSYLVFQERLSKAAALGLVLIVGGTFAMLIG